MLFRGLLALLVGMLWLAPVAQPLADNQPDDDRPEHNHDDRQVLHASLLWIRPSSVQRPTQSARICLGRIAIKMISRKTCPVN